MFPADSAWNRDVSADQVDPHSADYLAFMGAGSLNLHPDFGAPEYGQPFAVVSGSQERVPMSFLYASQSEPGPYPFPRDVPIQPSGDRHVVVLERDHCVLYETYNTYPSGGGFYADSGAVFDLRSGAPRPDGWTSATAAGLPILPGLARYDEVVEQGAVRHALTFVAGATAHAIALPRRVADGAARAAALRHVPHRQCGRPALLSAQRHAGPALADAGPRATQVDPRLGFRGGEARPGGARPVELW